MVLASFLAAHTSSAQVRVRTAAVLVAWGALVLAGCASAPAGKVSALSPGTTVFTPASAPRAPQVTGELLGGGRLRLASYRGHVVVLNFWGSWCTVCREEAPALSAAAQRMRTSAVQFVGVDVADGAASAEAFMRNFRIKYPSLFDPGDKIALSFNRIIPVSAFPSTLIISPAGRIIVRIIGAVSARNLGKLIKAALRHPTQSSSG